MNACSNGLLGNGDITAKFINSWFWGNRRITWFWVQTQKSHCKHFVYTLSHWNLHCWIVCLSVTLQLLNMKGLFWRGVYYISFKGSEIRKAKPLFHHWSSQQRVGRRSHGVTGRSGGSQGIHVHASSPPDHCGLLSAQTSCGLLSQ